MGCGISKCDLEEVGGPTRGFLRHPKRYTYPAGADTSYTTFLPKQPDPEETDSLDHNFDQKSVSSTAMGSNVGKIAGGSGVGAGGDHVVNAVKKDDNEDMMKREGVIAKEKGGDNNNIDNIKVRDIHDCHEDERGSISGRDDSIVRPGSPSFREYCAHNASKNGRSGDNYQGRIGAKVEKKPPQGEESLPKGQKVEVTKKKSKGSRIPGRSSVKNLLQSVACYNPSNRSTPHNDF